MMVPSVAVFVIVVMVVAAVRAAFGLKRGLHFHELRSEAMKHIFDHVVGPNTKSVVSNFSRQVPVSQMPREPHELMGIFVSDFYDQLRSCLNPQPPSIFQLQAIAIGHRNGLRKVKQDIFAMIRSQANTAAMARIKIQRQSACRFFIRPMPGGAMNRSIAHCRPQYRK
jgi:hypothetical protein